MTTGSQGAGYFTARTTGLLSREIYARVLPSAEAVAMCRTSGL
ncbi:MAG: hypothetical protein ACLTW9_00320 [Enterocloster sp.]